MTEITNSLFRYTERWSENLAENLPALENRDTELEHFLETNIVGFPTEARTWLVSSELPIEIQHNENLTTGNPIAIVVQIGDDTTNPGTADLFLLLRKGDGSTVGSISGDGAGGVQYNLTSDARLKDNIRDLDPRLFDCIDWHTYEMGGETRHGVVAQELAETELAHLTVEGEPWQVNYTGLIAIMGAKIAELSARLDSLEGATDGNG